MSGNARADDPHRGQPVLEQGEPLARARAAVLVLHGRGASAQDALRLAQHLEMDGVCFLAPQAADHEWYPQRFFAPIQANEPWLSSALRAIHAQIERIGTTGIPRERVIIGGFSQGACLALETAARTGGRFGGIFALSGAVIGPPESPRPLDRTLDATPIFIGCGDIDAHIPVTSVKESTRVLTALGARVTEQIYRGVGHAIVSDEIEHVREIVRAVATDA